MSTRRRLINLLSQSAYSRKKKLPPPNLNSRKWNIVRGDKVQVIGDHAEAGKQGIVLHVLRQTDRVVVEKVNVGTRQIKGNADRGIQGRQIQEERSIPYRNVNLVDPSTNEPTRVYRKTLEDGTKVRVSKKSGAIIPRPAVLDFRKRPVSSVVTESDTELESDVWEVTYQTAE